MHQFDVLLSNQTLVLADQIHTEFFSKNNQSHIADKAPLRIGITNGAIECLFEIGYLSVFKEHVLDVFSKSFMIENRKVILDFKAEVHFGNVDGHQVAEKNSRKSFCAKDFLILLKEGFHFLGNE